MRKTTYPVVRFNGRIYDECDVISALHKAGCNDAAALIEIRPGVGPRCGLCNTQTTWENVLAERCKRVTEELGQE